MWIQSFIVSDNSIGKALIIRASFRPVATGRQMPPNFAVSRKIFFKQKENKNPSPLILIWSPNTKTWLLPWLPYLNSNV